MKYLPSGKMVSKINMLSCRKNLLFVNKKKQKNFVNQGCIVLRECTLI